MWKKSLHEKYGYFDDKFKSAGDYEFWLRISDTERFLHLPELLGLYLLSMTSIEHSDRSLSFNESELARQRYWKSQKEPPSPGGAYVVFYHRSKQYKNDPLISVIIPTCNRPELLRNTLESLAQQTFKDFEAVVINDGNIDISKIVNEFEGRIQFQFIHHLINRERSASRNDGIKIAAGNYIAFLDDDNIFYPQHLEVISKHIDYNKVVYTNAIRDVQEKQGNSYTTVGKSVFHSIDYDRNKLFLGNIAPLNCFAFKKSLLYEAGFFNEHLNVAEDWELLIRIASLSGFKHVKEATVEIIWRNDITNTTTSHQREFVEVRNMINRKYQSEIALIPNKDEILSEFDTIQFNGKPINERDIVYTIHKNKFAESLQRAVSHINEKEFDLAYTAINESIENFNSQDGNSTISYSQVLNLAGNIALMLNKVDEARSYFEKALNEDSTSSNACAGLAEILFIDQNYEGSKIMFEYAISFSENNVSALEGLKKVNTALANSPGYEAIQDKKINSLMQINKRNDFGQLLNSLNLLEHGVEVGVQAGEFSRIIRSTWKGKYLHLVDRWKSDPGYKDIANITDEQHKKLYSQVVNTFLNDSGVFIYKMDSCLAAQQFRDEYFDWIYIDADHSYKGCKSDLNLWYSKIKPGGVFAGHDFIDGNLTAGEFGVQSAVEEFIKDKNVELHITNDDMWKSWYFVKPAVNQIKNQNTLTIESGNIKQKEISDNIVTEAYDLFKSNMYIESLNKLLAAEKYFNGHLSKPTNSALAAAFFNLKGYNYLGLNKTDDAKECFEHALILDPNSSEACAGLGQYFYLSGNEEHAKVMFEFAAKNNPENSFAVEGLAKINAILNLSKEHNSLLEDNTEKLRSNLSEILSSVFKLFELKKYDEALETLRKTEQLFYSQLDRETENHLISSYENLKGLILLALNKAEEAQESFELALNINPVSSQACAGIGEVFFISGKDKEAKIMYEWAVKNNPENKFAVEGLSKINSLLGFENTHTTLVKDVK